MSTNGATWITDSWIGRTFMVGDEDFYGTTGPGARVRRGRRHTSAAHKFTDTRLGGNFTINNPPQYTRNADLIANGLMTLKNGKSYTIGTESGRQVGFGGMGRFYSEQIDDNAQRVHMRFGVPVYNGWLTFGVGFYDNSAARLARTGRAGGFFYGVGKVAGFAVTLPLIGYIALGYALRFAFAKPSTKYYYMKPTMAPYWNRAQYIANMLAVNLGIVPPVYSSDDETIADITGASDSNWSKEDLKAFYDADPTIFKEGGGIDLYNVANRAQRLSHVAIQAYRELVEGASSEDELIEKLQKARRDFRAAEPTKDDDGSTLVGLESYLKRFYGKGGSGSTEYGDVQNMLASSEGASGDAIEQLKRTTTYETGKDSITGEATTEDTSRFVEPAWLGKWELSGDGTLSSVWNGAKSIIGSSVGAQGIKMMKYVGELGKEMVENSDIFQAAKDDLKDGSQFVSFKVDYTGTVQESFSNSARESDISSKFNGFSSSKRNARFNFADGNTGIGVIDGAIGAVKDLIGGALEGVQMSGLIGLFGSTFIDIPKHYDSSSTTFPSSSFTIELRSPYGNPMARYMNLYVPLSMLLAAALPLSTGSASYTAPFLCELYNRGRNQIRLGMIDNLSITRGTGNLGWTQFGEPLGIDISFSVMDLSSVMHAPIDPNVKIFGDDTAFNDYLATLGSMSMADQIYKSRQFFLNLTRKSMQIKSWWSSSYHRNYIMNDWGVSRALSSLTLAGARTTGQ